MKKYKDRVVFTLIMIMTISLVLSPVVFAQEDNSTPRPVVEKTSSPVEEPEINQNPNPETTKEPVEASPTPGIQPTKDPSQASPEDPLNIGLLFFYQKRWADSVEFFEEAFTKDPLNAMALSFYLSASFKRNQLIQAVNKIEQKAIAGGSTPLLKAQVGIAYISRGLMDPNMLEEARTQLKEALRDNPELSIANTGMGMIYYRKRLTSRAKGYFIKALKSNPNDLMAMELLGNILMLDEKKPDMALEFFLKLNQLSPKYCDGFFMAGSAYQKMGKYDEAITAFKRCMELDPRGVMKGYYAPIRIGDIYLNEKEWDQAKKYYKIALKINPENPYAKTQLRRAEGHGKEWTGTKKDGIKEKLDLKDGYQSQ